MTSTKLLVGTCRKSVIKSFSTSSASLGRHYKLLIVGSGSGGCATASKFSKKLGAIHVGIIEPKDVDFTKMQTQLIPCCCFGVLPFYRQDLRGIDSGIGDSEYAFHLHYGLQIPGVNLECMRCCLLYLQRRSYSVTVGWNTFVFYPDFNFVSGIPISVPPITAFLKIPRGGGRRGQIATGYDYNIGFRTARSFANSRTYQMYTPTGALSAGFIGPSRMESIAIDVVKRYELKDIKVNYAVAVLIEQYRTQHGMSTLSGCCSILPAM